MVHRTLRRLALALVALSAVAVWLAAGAMADTRQITAGGTGSPLAAPSEAAPDAAPFGLDPMFSEEDDEGEAPDFDGIIDRSLAGDHAGGPGAAGKAGHKAKAGADLGQSFEGLNLMAQRFANNGNSGAVEPPDQALCVGNGYVVEAVNTAFNVYDMQGHSLLPANAVNGAISLSQFYGYAPQIDRAHGNVRGPFITDPICLYDADTQRFFLTVLTLETAPNGAFLGPNHLDIAVSKTSDPTGEWKIYKIDVTGDGSNPDPDNACPCLGDYPHIGADANGLYLTTNSYPWDGDGFDGSQIYAFSKRQLAAGAASVNMVHIDTFGKVNAPSDAGATQPGFTVWPAQSPGSSSFDSGSGGTEWFMSSNAADEARNPIEGTGSDYVGNQIVVWGLKNTSSLDSFTPSLSLSSKILGVNQYAIPSRADQPGTGTAPGTDTPQGWCLNDETTPYPQFGVVGCWRLIVTPAAHARGHEVIGGLDANDTRMQQVTYANGKLWGALGTAVSFDANPANNKGGVAYYIVNPNAGKVVLQGTYGVPGESLLYPAVGVTSSGRGVVGMTAVGSSLYPSAAYAPIDAQAGIGDTKIAGEGQATQDGFSEYKQASNRAVIRPRWGDYGAAAVDGNSIWLASEYIAQACSIDEYLQRNPNLPGNPIGTCGGKRQGSGNWSTRISKITP